MSAPLILVETGPRDPATGESVIVRLAGAGAVLPYRYADQHWRAGLTGLPVSIARLDFDGEQLGGGGVPQALELRWAPAGNTAAAELARLYWKDAPIVVRVGPEGALPPIDTQGLVLDVSSAGGVLTLRLADLAVDLKKPLLTDRFAGTGGIEGPAEWEGQLKSRAWGRCFNLPGRPIKPGSNIWCFGDPRRLWRAFVDVRDMGVSAEAATLSVLDWQGSAEATFAALDAAATIAGGGVMAPSIACVKWWTTPAGDLHADVLGETAGGYVETAAGIAQRIVAARSALPFAPGAIASAAAARPAPFGWRCDSESVTAATAVSEILGDVSLSWVIEEDAIAFRAWDWAAPVRRARSQDVVRRKVVAPVATRRLGYRRNQAPMARGDLAAIVFARDVVMDDGTPADAAIADARKTADWNGVTGDGKPADNADVTADNVAKDTASVGGRPVAQFLERHDKALADIDDLFENGVGGGGAEAAQQAAEAARDATIVARDATFDAREAARQQALASATSATDADGFAITASGKADIATQKADEAGASATRASGSADIAVTRAGEAGISAGHALDSERNAKGSEVRAAEYRELTATTAADAGGAAMTAMRSPGAAPGLWTWDEFNTFRPGRESLRSNAVNPGAAFSFPNDALQVAFGGSLHIHPFAVTAVDPARRQRVVVRFRIVEDGTQPGDHPFYVTFWDKNGNLLFGDTNFLGILPGDRTVAMGPQQLVAEFRPADYGAGIAYMRPMYRTAGGTHVVQIDQLYIEDVEGEKRSADSAQASVTSAATASAKADEAGQSATAARQERVDAQAANGAAQAAAGVSQGAAATATAQAAAATQVVNLSSRFSANTINRNPTFSDWPDGAAFPTYWANWQGMAQLDRAAGVLGRNLAVTNSGVNGGGEQGFQTTYQQDQALGSFPGGAWYVLDCTITLMAGQFGGSGVHLNWYTTGGSATGAGTVIDFQTEAGLGEPGRTYRFTKLVKEPRGDGVQLMLYAMARWASLGDARRDAVIQWHSVGVRLASQGEIEARRADTGVGVTAARVEEVNTTLATRIGAVSERTTTTEARAGALEASTGIIQQSIATLEGKVAARLQLVAVGPGGRAQFTLYSDGQGSGWELVGDGVIKGNLLVDGAVTLRNLDRSTMTATTQASNTGLFGADIGNPGIYPVSGVGADMAIGAGGSLYFTASASSIGVTDGGVSGAYVSLQLLDTANNILGDYKLPVADSRQGGLANYVVRAINLWGARVIRWRLVNRSASVNGRSSATSLNDPNVQLYWTAL